MTRAVTLPLATSISIVLAALPAPPPAAADAIAGPQITIYNQEFALVKETRTLDLKEGLNQPRLSDVSAQVDPESVVLRDPKDAKGLRIIEQRYESRPISQAQLLRRHEGKTLQFQSQNPVTGKFEVRSGRLIRSGDGPPGDAQPGALSPIVEVDGRIQFSLPGEPIFDSLGSEAILRPTLGWDLWSDRAGRRQVELSYLTGGMLWRATYNVVAPENGDRFDLAGWVTLENSSGARFEEARIKLMAGEVTRIRPEEDRPYRLQAMVREGAAAPEPQVTERTFDEYHLYTLERPVTLGDGETKQVEFLRGGGIPGSRLYLFEGARQDPRFGAHASMPVRSILEFTNSKPSGLGRPLPKGTLKVFRADADGGREFIGESLVGHTPVDEKVRVELGSAFDLVGERRQTSFREDAGRRTADESFEIKLRNRKKVAAEVRVVEHLDRWAGWKIQESSEPYVKTDARTIEFRMTLPPGGEKSLTYQVHYNW